MSKKKYRYAERKVETETDYNLHVKEMISVLKHEKMKQNIYIKHVKLSKHAYQRFKERIDRNYDLQGATRYVRDELKDSRRIGTILSLDGRISILYVKDKIGYHMSPDLKTVVTIGIYNELNQSLVEDLLINKGLSSDYSNLSREELIKLHLDELESLEMQESVQCEYLLKVEKDVETTKALCKDLIAHSNTHWKKKGFKETISGQSYILKGEGRKLFKLSSRKRIVLRSLTALI